MLCAGNNRAGAFPEEEEDCGVEDHAERDGRYEGEEAVSSIKRRNGTFEAGPCNDPSYSRAEGNTEEEGEAERDVEPPHGVAADERELPEREVEDAEDAVDEGEATRNEGEERAGDESINEELHPSLVYGNFPQGDDGALLVLFQCKGDANDVAVLIEVEISDDAFKTRQFS